MERDWCAARRIRGLGAESRAGERGWGWETDGAGLGLMCGEG